MRDTVFLQHQILPQGGGNPLRQNCLPRNHRDHPIENPKLTCLEFEEAQHAQVLSSGEIAGLPKYEDHPVKLTPHVREEFRGARHHHYLGKPEVCVFPWPLREGEGGGGD